MTWRPVHKSFENETRLKTCEIVKGVFARPLRRLTYADLNNAFSPHASDFDVDYAVKITANVAKQLANSTYVHQQGEFRCENFDDEEESAKLCDITDSEGNEVPVFVDEDDDAVLDQNIRKGVESSYKVSCDCPKAGKIEMEAYTARNFATTRCLPEIGWALLATYDPEFPLVDIVDELTEARTKKEKLDALNKAVTMAHGSGDLATYFVEGGVATLDRVHLQKPSLVQEFHQHYHEH